MTGESSSRNTGPKMPKTAHAQTKLKMADGSLGSQSSRDPEKPGEAKGGRPTN